MTEKERGHRTRAGKLLSNFIRQIAEEETEFIKGADISFIPQIEDLGGKYYVDGVETNPIEIFCQSSFITYGCGFGILQQIVISELKRIT